MSRVTVFLSCSVLLLFAATASSQDWLPFREGKSPVKKAVPVNLTRSQDSEGLEVEFSFEGAFVEKLKVNSTLYTSLSIPGAGQTAEIGKPEVPSMGRFIAVPAGAEVTVEVLEDISRDVTGYHVYPAQEPPTDILENSAAPFEKNEYLYRRGSFYPEEIALVSTPFVIRGCTVRLVSVFPVQFNPALNKLRLHSRIRLRIGFKGGGITGMRDSIRSRSFDDFFGALLLNDIPEGRRGLIGEAQGGGESTGCELLIIAHPDFLSPAEDLAEWKVLRGIATEVVTTDVSGTTATEIENYVQNAYDTWDPAPSFLLLFGDTDRIPTGVGVQSVATDLGYIRLDGGDYFPDMFMGRICADDLAEANVVVSKVINYERYPDRSVNWFDDILLAAQVQSGRYFVATSEALYNYLLPLGYNCNRQYSGGTPSGSTQGCLDAINGGVLIANHRDHGSTSGWSSPSLTNSHISSMTNATMLPVMFSTNCSSGHFDGGYECFCEEMLTADGMGSVASVGATRTSYSGYNDELCKGYFDSIWPGFDPNYPAPGDTNPLSNPLYRMGQVVNYGKFWMYDKYVLTGGGGYPWTPSSTTTQMEFEMFHLHGDPTMEIWTSLPQDLDVSINPVCPLGAASFEVSVAEDGALVSLVQENEILGTAVSSGGSATVTFATLPVLGTMNVTVTLHDYVPHTGTTEVLQSSDGFISLDRENYPCSAEAEIEVYDADLTGAGTQNVEVATTVGDEEIIVLTETGTDTGIFTGTIGLSSGPIEVGNGSIQVSHRNIITATYLDADDGEGGINIPKTDEATADCQAPGVSGVAIEEITEESAAISWTTDELSICSVCYGTSPDSLDKESEETPLGTAHSLTLPGLSSGARYYLEVVAIDGVGHETVSDNNAVYYVFTTPGPDTISYYSTGFEDGALGSEWTAESSDGQGRIQVTTGNSPRSGSYHVTMDRYPAGDYTTNDLTLLIDLSSIPSGVVLRYWYKEWSDENNSEDGVSISNNGSTFSQIQSHNDGSSAWSEYVIDLDASATEAGVSLEDPVYIRWTQHDNYYISTDGIAIDDISIDYYLPVDTDGDGTPDNDDEDDDGDGLSDDAEVRDYGTDPVNSDTDGDGLSDGDEVATHQTDPADSDSDNDGLLDGEEINTYGTSANDADSDDDNYSDGVEVAGGSDPAVHGWTAANLRIRINFQSLSSRLLDNYAPASDDSYNDNRCYGWDD